MLDRSVFRKRSRFRSRLQYLRMPLGFLMIERTSLSDDNIYPSGVLAAFVFFSSTDTWNMSDLIFVGHLL
jgi:hypothetical protein